MSRHVFIGLFEREDDVLAAVRACRRRGFAIDDVHTPYPVHGLDEALGLRRSWLPWACFGFGAFGVVFALWLQFWTSAVAWPINVGGRPWNSLPAFVPITFELMVLVSGVGTVLVFLAYRRLWPGRQVSLLHARATDDRFVLVLDADGPAMLGEVSSVLEACGAAGIEQRYIDALPRAPHPQRLNVVLALLLIGALAGYWSLGADPRRPNLEFMARDMVNHVTAQAYAASPVLPGGQTLQVPAAGTIPRGLAPLPYAATPDDAVRAGAELTNPFAADDAAALQRGQEVYATYCQVCHGAGGLGDGPVTRRGVPPPPSLLAERARLLKDGQLFHIQTYGQANMPAYAAQVRREDRWKAILYIRQLQRAASSAPPAPPPSPSPAGR